MVSKKKESKGLSYQDSFFKLPFLRLGEEAVYAFTRALSQFEGDGGMETRKGGVKFEGEQRFFFLRPNSDNLFLGLVLSGGKKKPIHSLIMTLQFETFIFGKKRNQNWLKLIC